MSARATAAAIACALAVFAPASASAEDAADLSVRALPTPSPAGSLAMRAAIRAAPSQAKAPPDEPARSRPPSVGEQLQDVLAASLLPAEDSFERLAERVVFRGELGLGVDGGQPSGDPLGSGAALIDGGPSRYEPVRIYSFGDAVLGTRGMLVPSLSTYFAASWRLEQTGRPASGPVPSIYDAYGRATGSFVRSGYGEIHDLFRGPKLRPLFVRLGRQFRYGPAIAHFDGVTVGYDARDLSIAAFSGQRVSLYGVDRGAVDRLIAGADARARLLTATRTPLTLSLRALSYDGSAHADVGAALGLSRRAELRARVRTRGRALAREHISLRARLSSVTTLRLALDNRHSDDWSYDLVVAAPGYGEEDPRRYLSLGAPRPRMRLSIRAGTVLFDNLDLLVRAAAAIEHGDDRSPKSSFHADYLEGGAALEARIRRHLRVGSALLARGYRRDQLTGPVANPRDGAPQPLLADTGALGARSFVEVDASIAYVRGAREFTARAEAYTRRYRDPSPLRPDVTLDARSGGRFGVEGWAGDNLRLKAEYESALLSDELAPELRSVQSLRVILEGRL